MICVKRYAYFFPAFPGKVFRAVRLCIIYARYGVRLREVGVAKHFVNVARKIVSRFRIERERVTRLLFKVFHSYMQDIRAALGSSLASVRKVHAYALSFARIRIVRKSEYFADFFAARFFQAVTPPRESFGIRPGSVNERRKRCGDILFAYEFITQIAVSVVIGVFMPDGSNGFGISIAASSACISFYAV